MHTKLPYLVNKTLDYLTDNGFEVFVVGGSVRDALMPRKVKDWDFTTNATPEQLQKLFPESFYDNVFGTVGITVEELTKQFHLPNYLPQEDELNNHDIFEITTFRTEGTYSDNRRPDQVTWGKSVEEDLKRRDFTINALALKKIEEGEYDIVDLFGGERGLKKQNN